MEVELEGIMQQEKMLTEQVEQQDAILTQLQQELKVGGGFGSLLLLYPGMYMYFMQRVTGIVQLMISGKITTLHA